MKRGGEGKKEEPTMPVPELPQITKEWKPNGQDFSADLFFIFFKLAVEGSECARWIITRSQDASARNPRDSHDNGASWKAW